MIPSGRVVSNREKISEDHGDIRLRLSLNGIQAENIVLDLPNRQGGVIWFVLQDRRHIKVGPAEPLTSLRGSAKSLLYIAADPGAGNDFQSPHNIGVSAGRRASWSAAGRLGGSQLSLLRNWPDNRYRL